MILCITAVWYSKTKHSPKIQTLQLLPLEQNRSGQVQKNGQPILYFRAAQQNWGPRFSEVIFQATMIFRGIARFMNTRGATKNWDSRRSAIYCTFWKI